MSNDIDFKTTTSRVEFETLADDLKIRFGEPIITALESSGLTWVCYLLHTYLPQEKLNIDIIQDNITSIILMGGHSRVPMVQAAVRAVAGEYVMAFRFFQYALADTHLTRTIRTVISQNVNTDEAAVLGAAFYGASLSPQFKTKKIKLQDVAAHDIQISYETEGKSGPYLYFARPNSVCQRASFIPGKRTINNKLFPKVSTKLGAKKTLTFKRREDFSIYFSYNAPSDTPYVSTSSVLTLANKYL